jgi:23S rRNA pseudouridine1911/1915/1917 synthase
MHEPTPQNWTVSSEHALCTLAAFLRRMLSGLSWKQIGRTIARRRVTVNGEPCLDAARRLKDGDTIELLERPAPPPKTVADIIIHYLDQHIVVAEKPAGICTVRHPAERMWREGRKQLSPTLEDLVLKRILKSEDHRRPRKPRPRLRIVHRLDKETSGLVVFARSVAAERGLGRQFHAHTVMRNYLAVIPGQVEAQCITTRLVRDRGDGRRGSTTVPGIGKEAITHVSVVEKLPEYTVLACRLETGRTHQIRIHLAELGHPVCGEKVYNRKIGSPAELDPSGAPRLALHAAALGFTHPVTGITMHWEMPLPADLEAFLNRLRKEPRHA